MATMLVPLHHHLRQLVLLALLQLTSSGFVKAWDRAKGFAPRAPVMWYTPSAARADQ